MPKSISGGGLEGAAHILCIRETRGRIRRQRAIDDSGDRSRQIRTRGGQRSAFAAAMPIVNAGKGRRIDRVAACREVVQQHAEAVDVAEQHLAVAIDGQAT